MEGKLPSVPMQPCSFTLFRSCETFAEALCAQQDALEAGHASSSEGGKTKKPVRSKRKRTAKVLGPSFTDETDEEQADDGTSFANAPLQPPLPKRLPNSTENQQELASITRAGKPASQPDSLIQIINLPCEPSTSTTWPANQSQTYPPAPTFLTTSSPNAKSHTITPDLARLLLQHLERNYCMLQRFLQAVDNVVSAQHFEGPACPSLPLGSPEDLEKFETDLQDGELPQWDPVLQRAGVYSHGPQSTIFTETCLSVQLAGSEWSSSVWIDTTCSGGIVGCNYSGAVPRSDQTGLDQARLSLVQ